MSATTPNPWVSRPGAEVQPIEEPLPPAHTTGPQTPQGGVPAPSPATLIPLAKKTQADLWVLGTHGGAGESTLASLSPGWREADRVWPHVPGERARVVLVARSHAHGLRAAQAAAIQWASGHAPDVDLVGLVVIHDAPGRLPRELRDLLQIVSGGVPRTWSVPWVEAWRFGGEISAATAPRDVRRVIDELRVITKSITEGTN